MSARKAALDVVPETQTEVSAEELVDAFLNGREAHHEDYHSIDNILYHVKTPIARRCNDGEVLLRVDSIDNVSVNDELIGQLFAFGHKFRRLPNFTTLTDPVQRITELNEGKFENFGAAAKLFGFDFDDADFQAIKRTSEFKARVNDFFTNLQRVEREKAQTAAERAAREKAEREAIEWDTGAGNQINSLVQGSGGGQRLRLSPDRADRVQASSGHTLTLKQAKATWDYASQYWHGGKKHRYSSYSEKQIVNGGYSGVSYSATVYDSEVRFGCQRVTRDEAERFAATQGWERARPSA